MITKNKYFFLFIVIAFIGSFLWGMNYNKITTPDEIKYGKKDSFIISTKKPTKSAKNTPITPLHQNKGHMIALMQKLKQTKDSDRLSELFDECKSVQNFRQYYMLYLVVKKWAEVAPLQCLAKLEATEGGMDHLSCLFYNWTAKNPETAIAYYEKNYMGRTQAFIPNTLKSIINEYAKIDLKKATTWLHSHEQTLTREEWREGKKALLSAIAAKSPDLVPQHISDIDKEDIKEMAYELGLKWGDHTTEQGEWINTLSDDSRIKAEAGRIMGITKGDISKINDHILNLSPNDIIRVNQELAYYVLNESEGNIPEKINWIMENLPEKDISTEIQQNITIWMREDKTNAEKWLNTLSSGSKKDLLKKLYDQRIPVTHTISS